MNTTTSRRAVETASMNEALWSKRLALRNLIEDSMNVGNEGRRRKACDIQLVSFEDALAAAFEQAGLGTPTSGEVSGSYNTFEFEWAFTVGCTLHVNGDRAYESLADTLVTLPNGAKFYAATTTAKVDISWSGTGRSVAQAAACVNLYGQVVGKAQMIEQLMDGKKYLTAASWSELAAEVARTVEDVADEKARIEAQHEANRLEREAREKQAQARAAKKAAKLAKDLDHISGRTVGRG